MGEAAVTDNSMPAIKSDPCFGGWHGKFKKPGGSWDSVKVNGTPSIFPNEIEAERAAMSALLQSLCRPIRFFRLDDTEAEKMARALGADVFMESRTLRQAGKRAVVVETKRRPV